MDLLASEPDRRMQILEAAERIFAERGFHPARVEDVARAAGVAKGTVYMYFESKQQLLEEVLVEAMRACADRVSEAMEPPGDARERLERGLMTGVEYLSEHEGVIRTMIEPSFQLQEPVHRRLLEQNRRIVEAAEHCIRAGLAAGELRSVDPSLAALIFASLLGALITGRIFHSESTGGADSISFDHPAALAQAALDLLYEGLRIR